MDVMEWGCRLPHTHTKKKKIDYESCFFFTQKFSAWCRKKLLRGTQSSTKTRTSMSTLKQRGKTVTSLPYVLFDWAVQRSPTTTMAHSTCKSLEVALETYTDLKRLIFVPSNELLKTVCSYVNSLNLISISFFVPSKVSTVTKIH